MAVWSESCDICILLQSENVCLCNFLGDVRCVRAPDSPALKSHMSVPASTLQRHAWWWRWRRKRMGRGAGAGREGRPERGNRL